MKENLTFSKGEYQWFELIDIVEHYFIFWENQSDKSWGELMWRIIAKNGLTKFENEKEEMDVRERVVLLALIYYEFCHQSSFHESLNFKYWNEEIVVNYKKDIDLNTIENALHKIYLALLGHFRENELLAEFWVSATQGSSDLPLTTEEKYRVYNRILNEREESINISSARKFAYSGFDSYEEYYCIA